MGVHETLVVIFSVCSPVHIYYMPGSLFVHSDYPGKRQYTGKNSLFKAEGIADTASQTAHSLPYSIH